METFEVNSQPDAIVTYKREARSMAVAKILVFGE